MIDKIGFHKAIKYLFAAKAKQITEEIVSTWYEVLSQYDETDVFTAIKKLALNPDDFINVGKIIELMHKTDDALAEKEWCECLDSARRGGRIAISARAAKALNSFGGMRWLREGNLNEIQWKKKQFLETYKNTPAPVDVDFVCLGLETKPYLKGTKNELATLQ